MTTPIDRKAMREVRLSDRILYALEQEDVQVADMLTRALEMSMTRNTGGGEFVERRDYPAEIEEAMRKLHALKARKGVARH